MVQMRAGSTPTRSAATSIPLLDSVLPEPANSMSAPFPPRARRRVDGPASSATAPLADAVSLAKVDQRRAPVNRLVPLLCGMTRQAALPVRGGRAIFGHGPTVFAVLC